MLSRAEEVAKKDKCSMRSSLAFLRSNNKISKCLDGWDLIHVGLAAVRELSPDAWTRSFIKVNLHPHHSVPFPEWCKRISGFLQGGESFKPEHEFDPYALLPGWWHAFSPDEKRMALSIFQEHDTIFTVDCVRALHDGLHAPMDDLQHLRVCLDHAIADPSQLDRGMPDPSDVSPPAAAAEAQAAVTDPNQGLISFQLHPKKADGTSLFSPVQKFAHLIALARRSVPDRQSLKISTHLDVAVSAEQATTILNPTAVDYMMHEIASHTTGIGAQRRLAKRKLDSMGNATGQCGVLNDAGRLVQLENQLQLAKSMAAISKQAQEATQQTKSLAATELLQLAPAAITKLQVAKSDPMQRYVKEIEAIVLHSFNCTKLSGDKKAKAAGLNRLMKAQPEVLRLALQEPQTLPVVTVTGTLITPPALAAP